jgi:aryl-alcohol dehydrogenase-like predicted oxidoreductase
MRRRSFLQMNLMGVLGLSGLYNLAEETQEASSTIHRKPLLQRVLGRTGERVSIIGLGGVVVMDQTQETANAIVQKAIAHGVNFVDTAPAYGNSEEILGVALKSFRDNIFLSSKTMERTRSGAEQELIRSLERLQTDHLDLYMLHGFRETRDVNRALGRGGAIEAFLQAKEEGKIRYIGFSSHSAEAALQAIDDFEFDILLFPVNYVSYLKANFGPEVIAKARQEKMGIIGFKSLARQPWPSDDFQKHWLKSSYEPVLDPEEADLALRFSLSQPIAAVIPPGDERLFQMALEMGHGFRPINDREERQLRRMAHRLEPLFKLQS